MQHARPVYIKNKIALFAFDGVECVAVLGGALLAGCIYVLCLQTTPASAMNVDVSLTAADGTRAPYLPAALHSFCPAALPARFPSAHVKVYQFHPSSCTNAKIELRALVHTRRSIQWIPADPDGPLPASREYREKLLEVSTSASELLH